MPEVYNWQLGRKMSYVFEESHPEKQFVAIFNINRCIGCQTCTGACKATWTFSKGQEYMWWNNVETKPYGGYPQHWDIKILKQLDDAHQAAGKNAEWDTSQRQALSPYGVYNGLTITEAGESTNDQALGYLPEDKEWTGPNFYEDTATGYKGDKLGISVDGASLPVHQTWFFYLQRICNHCTYPACAAACPRKAVYKRPEDGIVLIDQARCRGYRKCVEQCPYKKSMYRGATHTSEKCVACYPRVEGNDPLSDGVPMETRCMAVCPGKIRLNGLVEIAADGSWVDAPRHPLYHLIMVDKIALPLLPPVWYRAEHLLHSTALGTASLPVPNVWSRRGRGHCPLCRPQPRDPCRSPIIPYHPEDDFQLRDRRRTSGSRNGSKRRALENVQRYRYWIRRKMP